MTAIEVTEPGPTGGFPDSPSLFSKVWKQNKIGPQSSQGFREEDGTRSMNDSLLLFKLSESGAHKLIHPLKRYNLFYASFIIFFFISSLKQI